MKHRPASEDLCSEIPFYRGIADQEFPCGPTSQAVWS